MNTLTIKERISLLVRRMLLPLLILSLYSTLLISCNKIENIKTKEWSGIKIKVEDFYGDDVNPQTKAGGNYAYTILAYKDGTLKKSMKGTVDDEGNFHIDNNGISGTISEAGTYKFICMANGTLSGNDVSFSRRSATSTIPALLSDVIEQTITTADITSSKQLDLNFIMRHKEGAIAVRVDAEETIPSNFTIKLQSTEAEPSKNTYTLPNGVVTPTTNTKSNINLTYSTKALGTTKSFTTEYLYFLEGTGMSNNLKLTFGGPTTFCGHNLSEISAQLDNLPMLKPNKRYVIVVTFEGTGIRLKVTVVQNWRDSNVEGWIDIFEDGEYYNIT